MSIYHKVVKAVSIKLVTIASFPELSQYNMYIQADVYMCMYNRLQRQDTVMHTLNSWPWCTCEKFV